MITVSRTWTHSTEIVRTAFFQRFIYPVDKANDIQIYLRLQIFFLLHGASLSSINSRNLVNENSMNLFLVIVKLIQWISVDSDSGIFTIHANHQRLQWLTAKNGKIMGRCVTRFLLFLAIIIVRYIYFLIIQKRRQVKQVRLWFYWMILCENIL